MPLLPDPPGLIRLSPPRYGDGISALTRIDDAAGIAALLFDQDGDMPDPFGLSALMVDWGQFIDHDLDLTRDASGEFLQVPGLVGPFQRSVHDPGSGTGTDNPRLPVNEITAAIDGNMVYGATATRTTDLRSFEGGRLRALETEAGMLMPLLAEGEVMGGAEATESPIFFAGDLRANENLGLTMLHTLFLREHNGWADRLAARHPDWNDDQLFEAARAIVEYELQAITYRDWLPLLLTGQATGAAEAAGAALMATLPPEARGEISVEFSTAAFRFGHTMVSSAVPVLEEDGTAAAGIALAIEDVVFNPRPLLDGYFEHLVRGQSATPAQALDGKIIDDLNFFLRAPDGVTGFSLAALNILRGRDHGLSPYLEVRAALLGDLDPAAVAPGDFSVITADPAVQAELAAVYDSVRDVDLWVGGLVEDRPAGTLLGPLFAHVIAEQFARTRLADPDFMALPEGIDPDLLALAEGSTLRDVILRNTGLTALQDDPFLAAARQGGSAASEALTGTARADLIFAQEGDDSLSGGAGDDTLEGGPGRDTAMLSGSRDHYELVLDADGTSRLHDRRTEGDGTDTLRDIEALSFLDGEWALDIFSGVVNCTEAELRSLVELYIANFGRAPDSAGLCFWASVLAEGMTLDDIARLFFDQDETRALYGEALEPAAFVAAVYANVLDRAPDAPGGAFWTGLLEQGVIAAEDFVLTFLGGVHGPPDPAGDPAFIAQKQADVAHLAEKTDLGLNLSVIRGLNDVETAWAVMQLHNGTPGSLEAAQDMAESAWQAAAEDGQGGFLVSLVGVVDDPFAF
jgi:hypothetical protein